MIREVVKLAIETRTYYRAILDCGHMYTRLLPVKDRIKKRYICHSCKNQVERAERGAKPMLKRRKNK
jgi:hypothetical protein